MTYRYNEGGIRKPVTRGSNARADVFDPKLANVKDRPKDLVSNFESWYLAGGNDHGWLLKELQIEHIKEAK